MIDVRLDEKLSENYADVIIEDDVWIASNVIILKGVTIGEGSIICAGVVIFKNVPPYSIVAGCSERKVRRRWSEKQILEHKQKLKLNEEK